MNPKKLNVADIRNIIRLEENEINGPTYQDYKKSEIVLRFKDAPI